MTSLKVILIIVVGVVILFVLGYFLTLKIVENKEAGRKKIEAEKQLNDFLEQKAREDSKKIEELKANSNQLSNEVNSIRNANLSNLNNDDLRQKIIEEAGKRK